MLLTETNKKGHVSEWISHLSNEIIHFKKQKPFFTFDNIKFY